MQQNTDSVSRDHPLFFSLFATLFLVAFSFTSPYMAGPYLVGDLGGSNSISIYAIGFFGLGSALSVPLGKPLLAYLQVRKTLVSCTLAMAVFTLLCATAPTYSIFLVYRLLGGFAAGPLYSTLNFSLSSLVAPEKKTAALSIFITILTVVPVLSACYGGWLAYEFIWRWIYYSLFPFFLILAYMQTICFREIDLGLPKMPFDWVGYTFFFISTFFLSLSMMMAQELDWYRSPLWLSLMLIGVPCLIFYILWSLSHPYPLLDLRMLYNPNFVLGLVHLIILSSAYFGMITLLSLWLKLYANYTPYWIGIIIGAMAVTGLFPRFLIEGRLSTINPRIPLGLATLFLMLSCFYTTTFDTAINFERIAFSRIVASFGLALFLPPIFQLCFQSFPSHRAIDVIELFQVVRNLAGGLGATSYNILWQRRQVFFHERLGEGLNDFSHQTHQFFAKIKQLQVPGNPNAHLHNFLEQRATSLALDDTFWFMGWVLFTLFCFLLLETFFRKKPNAV